MLIRASKSICRWFRFQAIQIRTSILVRFKIWQQNCIVSNHIDLFSIKIDLLLIKIDVQSIKRSKKLIQKSIKISKVVDFSWKSWNKLKNWYIWTFSIKIDHFQFIFDFFWSISKFLTKTRNDIIELITTINLDSKNLDQILIKIWFDYKFFWFKSSRQLHRLNLTFYHIFIMSSYIMNTLKLIICNIFTEQCLQAALISQFRLSLMILGAKIFGVI